MIFAVWTVFACLYFGSPLPNTLERKMLHPRGGGDLWHPYFIKLGRTVAYHFKGGLFTRLAWLYDMMLIASVPGLLMALRRNRPLQIFCAFSLLQIAGYSILKVPGYHWYYHHGRVRVFPKDRVALYLEVCGKLKPRLTEGNVILTQEISLIGMALPAASTIFSAWFTITFHPAAINSTSMTIYDITGPISLS